MRSVTCVGVRGVLTVPGRTGGQEGRAGAVLSLLRGADLGVLTVDLLLTAALAAALLADHLLFGDNLLALLGLLVKVT